MKIFAKGIDVSVNQGNIDWQKVKKAGIQFAMIKCSWGVHVADNFERNYAKAKAEGIPIGAYCYSYAMSVEGAKREAEAVLKILEDKKFEYPIAFDIEEKIQKSLGKKTLTEMCKAFCSILEKAGYYVCIYTNLDWSRNYLDMAALSSYDVWFAQINKVVTYEGAYGMWQYSWKGRVKGISGDVDLDYAYKDYPTIIKNAGLNGYTKEVVKPTEPTKPTPKKHIKGEAIRVKNKPLYASATAKSTTNKKSGVYYIYDGEKINGRYRVTINKHFCGKKPIGLFVTGWMEL